MNRNYHEQRRQHIDDVFKEWLDSHTATASRIGRTIHEDFHTWQQRSLAGYDVLYLFVDGL
ncbi:MAG: hypothetical protein FLDDKLPJ_02462 [Phycisphaerae bacterium]|nr:hypothetical protein [Phycisphaerae bacterium]